MEIEEKLIVAKLMDKIKICKTRNKIVNTEFLSIYQMEIIQKELNRLKLKNYIFFRGYEDSESKILILYPEKFELDIVNKNLDEIIKAIKINLPKELYGQYSHRDYLGAVMKTGLNRNRVGDIIVHEDCAYIFVLNENSSYIANSLKDFTRFNKAEISVISYKDVKIKEQEFEEMQFSISSIRLDNFISEMVKISRSKTEELLLNEKIFVNSKVETKGSKAIKENDILAIRGNGKYIISEFVGNNKKGKMIVRVKKYK